MEDIPDSWDVPEVSEARCRLQDVIDELKGGEFGAPTNYFDNRAINAIRTALEQGRMTRANTDALNVAYGAFCDALLPYQPTPEIVQQAVANPAPWSAPPPKAGQVFYFVPHSGGYWITGKDEMTSVLVTLRDRLPGDTPLNGQCSQQDRRQGCP
jgi:hypothetical protein